MDPYHVIHLAAQALDVCRRRVQQDTCGHRGRRGDPLFTIRLTLHTGADLLTERQAQRLETVFADEAHIAVEATWAVYQQMIAAYRDPDRAKGKTKMEKIIATASSGVPAALREVIALGRTLKRRATDILSPPNGSPKNMRPTYQSHDRQDSHARGNADARQNPANGSVAATLHALARLERRRLFWSTAGQHTSQNSPGLTRTGPG